MSKVNYSASEKLALETVQGSKPMLHSDRGFQYTSLRFKRLFGRKITQSISRVGRCIDNGPMEFRIKAA